MSDIENYVTPESIWEMRRKAPFHFWSKANNARMSAFALSHISAESSQAFASEAGYNDSVSIALGEGFRREASIAIELILKAVVCSETKKQPDNSHDVYEMWSASSLPSLVDDDMHRLVQMTEILYWSGRYAAPTKDANLEKSQTRFEKHGRNERIGSLRLKQLTSLNWDDFDRLYKLAEEHFWSLNTD